MHIKERLLFLVSLFLISSALFADTTKDVFANMTIEPNRPADFVNVKEVIPQIQTDIRYDSDHNFIGKKVAGYKAPICLLTQSAAQALKTVEDQLLTMGLTLKAYDCYRPQTAVAEFAKWATKKNDTKMKAEFYPTVNKADLFKKGYLAYYSGHTRGSTIDLTIVPVNSQIPVYDPKVPLVNCMAPKAQRFADNSLDFGTGYDCLSPIAAPNYRPVSTEVKANRLLLQSLMLKAGFMPTATEWWHFSLANEPYPNTYFDFPVQD